MERLKGAVVIAVLRLVALLPWSLVQRLGALIGWLLWRLPGRARTVVRINLERCFPEMAVAEREQLARRTLGSIGRTFAESACIWLWPPQKSLALVKEVEGLEVLQAALASGKGVVIIASHQGNWEILAPYLSSLCQPVFLYRPPKVAALDALLQQKRAQHGGRVAASTREGVLSIMKEVRRGGVAGIPADPEPAEGSGEFVPFFAVQALTSKFVPGMLAGGKAVGVFVRAIRLEDGSGFRVSFDAAPEAMYEKDSQAAVAAMSRMIEDSIRRWPEQYMWSMKRFKRRPAGEARWY